MIAADLRSSGMMGDSSESLDIQVLLKKIYDVHRNALKESNSNNLKYKTQCQRLSEKNKQLVVETEVLKTENTRLQSLVTQKQSGSGACCEVIRQSLETVITSYRQLLQEKESRIKQLDEENLQLKQQRTSHGQDLYIVQNGNKSVSADGSHVNHPTNEDGYRSFEDAGTQKLKLQKRSTKRSRYSEEEVSPEVKRQRQISPDGPQHKNQSCNKEIKDSTDPINIFVPDTCKMDETIAPEQFMNMDRFRQKNNKSEMSINTKRDAKSKFEESLVVIPETVPVDYDESDDEDTLTVQEDIRRSKTKKFVPDLSDIQEQSGKSNSQISVIDAGVRMEEDPDETSCVQNTSIKQTSQFSLKTALSSPGYYETDRVLCLDPGASESTLVHDSDEDVDTESCSQTFGRPKSSSRQKGWSYEVRKNNSKEEKGRSLGIESPVKLSVRPLFKKKQNVLVDEQMLRRSPRKHKQRCEVNLGTGRKKEQAKQKIIEKTRDVELEFDPDVTVAPENGHGQLDGSQHEISQSLDCYSVVPLKNGAPVSGKAFQVKVAKEKNVKTSPRRRLTPIDKKMDKSARLSANLHGNRDREDNSDRISVARKSPCTLPVVSKLRSPSIGSVSDPESPLLLKVEGDRKLHQRHKGPIIAKQEKYADTSSRRHSTKSSKVNTSLKQTTLTQKFFHSPEKENVIDLDSEEDGNKVNCENATERNSTDSDEDLQKALEESLLESRKGRLRSRVASKTKTEDYAEFKQPQLPVQNKRGGNRRTAVDVQGSYDDISVPLHDITDLGNRVQKLNGSLDPAVELTQWCKEPVQSVEGTSTLNPSMPSLGTDFCIVTGAGSQPTTSTLALTADEPMESQYIPCSSSSYKFSNKRNVTNTEDVENVPPVTDILEDSFDRPPKKQESNIAQVTVVRKRDERQKLQGHGCKQCLEYYKAAGRTEAEAHDHMQKCSRHRAEYVPPDTPPHYWSIGFIETQDCQEEDDLKFDEEDKPPVQEVVSHRRRRRLNKCFKSKNETSTLEPLSQDLDTS